MVIGIMIFVISALIVLTFLAVDKAVQIGNPQRITVTESLFNFLTRKKMAEKKEVDVVKIFAELEKKAYEINPNLVPQIQSFNSNNAGMQSYQNYLAALNQTSTPVASNKVS